MPVVAHLAQEHVTYSKVETSVIKLVVTRSLAVIILLIIKYVI
jgi:hypothetical protein